MAREYKNRIPLESDGNLRYTLRDRGGKALLSDVTLDVTSKLQQQGDPWGALEANLLMQIGDDGVPVTRRDNPHKVTAAQTGAYTKAEADTKLNGKANTSGSYPGLSVGKAESCDTANVANTARYADWIHFNVGRNSMDAALWLGNYKYSYPDFGIGFVVDSTNWIKAVSYNGLQVVSIDTHGSFFYTEIQARNLVLETAGVIGKIDIEKDALHFSIPSGGFVFKSSNGENGVCYAKNFVSESSRRYKENITPLTDAQALALLRMLPVEYDYINGDKAQYGLIAEDVAELQTQCVTFDKEGLPNALDYSKFTPQLIRLCQLQQTQIDSLEQSVLQLLQQAQIDSLTQTMQQISQRIDALETNK